MKNQKPMQKIFIIDDEDDSIAVFFTLLEDMGYTVGYENNSEKAIDRLIEDPPNLIVMDWMMPGLSGIQLVEIIRKHDTLSDIPIIIATGMRTSFDDLKIALDAGATDYIKKPVIAVEFEARVKAAISHYESMLLQKKQQEIIHKQEIIIANTRTALMEKEVQRKGRELLSSSMSSMEIQAAMEKLQKEIIDSLDHQSENLKKIKDIFKRHGVSGPSAQLKEFQLRFNEIHHSFFDNLLLMYPNITANERRLCALIKIGMDNKEIAQMINSHYETVRKAIYRLRKKLQLTEDESISVFLNKI